MKITLPVLLALFFCSTFCDAKDPYFLNYSTHNGLPSSEVYDVAIDSNGVAWFCTDRGVCSFNSYGFQRYTTREGLSNNSMLEVRKDPDGRLWFSGLDGTLSHTVQGGVTAYKGNDRLVSIVGKDRLIKSVFWGEDGSMYLIHIRDRSAFCLMASLEGDFVRSMSFEELASYSRQGFVHGYRYSRIGDQLVMERNLAEYLVHGGLDVYYIERQSGAELVRGQLDREDFKQSYPLGGVAHDLYMDRAGDLWVSMSDGLLRFPGGDLEREPDHYFRGVACSSVAQDREGNVWVSTLGQGVFFVPSFKFQQLDLKGGSVKGNSVVTLLAGRKHLMLGTMDGRVAVLDSSRKMDLLVSGDRFFGRLGYGTQTKNRMYLNLFKVEEDNGRVEFDSVEVRDDLPLKMELENGGLMCAGYAGYRVYMDGELTYDSERHQGGRIFCALEEGANLFLGTMQGLLVIENGDFSHPRPFMPKAELLKTRVNDMASDDFGNLWLATIGNGLLCVQGDSLFQLGPEEGVYSNMINQLDVDRSGRLWAATNEGLYWIEYEHTPNFRLRSVQQLNLEDGLPTNFIRDVASWQDRVWLGTDKGLIHFAPRDFEDMDLPPPAVFIEEVRMNRVRVDVEEKKEWEADENNLALRFVGVSNRKSIGEPYYRFRLLGVDSAWSYTDDRTVHFYNLASGEYRFEVAARNRHGEWSGEAASYAFVIKERWMETWWFKALLAVLALTLIAGAFRLQAKRLKQG